jgi:MurNAc alpha-1-phosphate uridylyltransferase
MKAMILAAGLGSRLRPFTNKLPKPLLKIGSVTLIERSLNNLKKLGVDEFIINISYLGDQIKDAMKSSQNGTNITFIEEPFPFGTGGALVNAKAHLGNEPFMLSTSDIIFDLSQTKLPVHVESAHLIAVKNPDHNQKGDFSINKSTVFVHNERNDFTYSGVSVINPKILEAHVSREYPFDLWNTILKPLVTNSLITAHLDNSLWIDVGTEDRLELARRVLKDEN